MSLLIVREKADYSIWICPVFYVSVQRTESWSIALVPSAPAAVWPAPAHAPREQGSLLTRLKMVFFQLSYLLSTQSACLSSANSCFPWSSFSVSYELTSTHFFVWLSVGVFLVLFFPLFSIVFSPSFLYRDLQTRLSFCLLSPSVLMWCSLTVFITLADSFPFPNSSYNLNLF